MISSSFKAVRILFLYFICKDIDVVMVTTCQPIILEHPVRARRRARCLMMFILLGRTLSYGNDASHRLDKQSLQDVPASLQESQENNVTT